MIEQYLTELRRIRSSGAATDETSLYVPLANLLNEIGKELKPKVRCIMTLRNQGAGMPDGGLFTQEQFQKSSSVQPDAGQSPARGVIEVKGTTEDAWLTADGEQVSRYWSKYRLVLVTNYRDFVLLGRDVEGRPTKLETYRLAGSEEEFWLAASTPRAMASLHGERLVEYLKRVMLYAAPIASPKDLAWFLASHARDARVRIEQAELPVLIGIRSALEEGLGMKFEGRKGDHFFKSTLVQTLFYGIFSAWVLWSKQHTRSNRKVLFDWRTSAHHLKVPILRKLFYEIAEPGQLDVLKLSEVLDWTGTVLNRVDRTLFFAAFEEEHAVQYFYEPFLEAFDPELRKELGVWYTPTEIVQYMVARVDTALREELHVEDGLANRDVYVLDPCCGTGAYLVEVLKTIHRTLKEKGNDALVANDLKQAAIGRVFGFEILPAPFVVSHLQIGLLLQNLGVPLSPSTQERVGVYLTNALTGWEPPKKPKTHLGFAELEEERDAAEEVKRDKPILVILGNPPYNAFAGVSPEEELGLVEPYKKGLIPEWGIKKFNLDDLYVRFFRLAERRIAERTGRGVVCFISNFSYLSDPSFVVMRQRFINEFDALWFDCMNGDSRETGKLTPEGKPDPSVFSTEYNREGIRVGTAIGLLVRDKARKKNPTIRFRQFWGVNKRVDLIESLNVKKFNATYEKSSPDRDNRFSFIPGDVSEEYSSWPRVTEISLLPPFNGPIERRANSLIVFGSEVKLLEKRLRVYFNQEKTDSDVGGIAPEFMHSSGEFDAPKTRANLKGKLEFNEKNLARYPFKPFDVRFAYLDESIQPLFSRPSPELLAQRAIPRNEFFITRDTADKDPEGPPFFYSRLVCDYDSISGHARHFPVLVQQQPKKNKNNVHNQNHLFEPQESYVPKPVANLSAAARRYLSSLKIGEPDKDIEIAKLIWLHSIAIGFSPAYLTDNADGVRQDWPRIPLPNSRKLLIASAEIGKELSSFLDTESEAKGITAGSIRSELKAICVTARVGGGTLNPSAGDLALTVGWGHAGKDDATMPGKGKLVERSYDKGEMKLIEQGAKTLKRTREKMYACLGETTYDVYLNDKAYWKNMPANVWHYTLGGYQVIKKWLSYREQDLLRRPLTNDDAREVMNMARRIAALLLLEPKLDRNYEKVRISIYPWHDTERQ